MIRFTNWLDDHAFPWLCQWLIGWPRYKLGACPACSSDDCHPTHNPGNCDVCEGTRKIDRRVWERFKHFIR